MAGALITESFTPDNQTVARAAAIWRSLANPSRLAAKENLAFLRGWVA